MNTRTKKFGPTINVTLPLYGEALINFRRAMQTCRLPEDDLNWRRCLAWNIVKVGSLAIAQAGWFHIGNDVAFDVRHWTEEEKAADAALRLAEENTAQ